MNIQAEVLTKYAMFGGLSVEQVKAVLPFMETHNYKAGTKLLKEGEHNDRVFFILQGKVLVQKNGIGLAEFGSGDAAGEMELLGVMPASATLLALTEVETITLSNAALYKIYKKDIYIYAMIIQNLARELARRLQRMDELKA